MKTNITNNFSISTTFTADGGTITKTTRVLDGGKVVLVQVFGRGGKVEHAEYVVTTPAFRGVIHSDLQRGFIRAEVTAYDDLIAAGDMAAAKAANKVRLEGKAYVVQDGDILEIRFSV